MYINIEYYVKMNKLNVWRHCDVILEIIYSGGCKLYKMDL